MKSYQCSLILWIITAITLGLEIFFIYLSFNFYNTDTCEIYNLNGPVECSYRCDYKFTFNYKPLNYDCQMDYYKSGNYIDLLDEINEKYLNKSTINCYYIKGNNVCDAYVDPPFMDYFLFITIPLGFVLIFLVPSSICYSIDSYEEYKKDKNKFKNSLELKHMKNAV